MRFRGALVLAIREMRRAKVRFGLLTAAVGLLVFLILFQQALQDGLLTSFVGALRSQSAPVLVYSVDGQRTLQGSVITPDLEALVREEPAVGAAGRIGVGTFTVAAAGESLDATVFGFEGEDLGAPTIASGRLPRTAGEAVASAGAEPGFAIGDIVSVFPGGPDLTVVGVAADAQLNVTPTLFVPYDTYVAAVTVRSATGAAPLPSAIALVPAAGTTPEALTAAIDARSDDLEALTGAEAADLTPGVAQVRQSFQIIFLLYGLVVPLVIGLFFLIVTIQKARSLTLLRAVGAPAPRLVTALLAQVVVVVAAGVLLGAAAYYPLTLSDSTGLTLRFDPAVVAAWGALLLTLGLLASLLAARRVLALDPVAATGGQGGLV